MTTSTTPPPPGVAPEQGDTGGTPPTPGSVVVEPAPAQPPGTPERNARLGAAGARLATYSLRFLLVVAAVYVLVIVLGRLWSVLLPVLLGLLLATILWPPVRALRKAGLKPALAAAIVILTATGVLVGLIAYLVPQVTGQTQELANSVSGGLENLQGLLTGPPLNLGQERIGDYIDQVVGELQTNAQTIAGRVLGGVTALGGQLLNALLAVVLCFFFVKDGPKFLPWIGALLGPTAAPHARAISERSWNTLSGFIKAQAAVGLVDAVFIGVGLAVLGVPLAMPLAVLTFFGAFIPIIGAVITGALAALVALVTNGVTTAIIVVVIVLIVQQLEGNVLQPLLVGRALDLHPGVVILAIAAGSSLAGITGAFLSVPIVSVAAVVIRYLRQQLDEAETGDAPTSLAASPDHGPAVPGPTGA